MSTTTLRRVILIVLVLIVAIGCAVPSFFHDEYTVGRDTYLRNRMTGDVRMKRLRLADFSDAFGTCCFGP